MKFRCAHCGKTADKPAGHVNRSRRIGMRLFCSRKCSGHGKRHNKTDAQKRAEKAAYDKIYRAENLARIKASKKEYFKRTYDPVAAAEYRKTRMPSHVEYCRRPEYRVKKSAYDRKRRAAEYGDFAEAFMLTIDLNRTIKGVMTNEQIKWENGSANKAQFRKREGKEGQERGRPRHRKQRAASHSPTHGW